MSVTGYICSSRVTRGKFKVWGRNRAKLRQLCRIACDVSGCSVSCRILATSAVLHPPAQAEWCRPIAPNAFEHPPPPIRTAADRAFARDMNQALHAYLPLWDYLDRLMVLYPHDYGFSQQWRQQAEQQMRATGKSGMSEAAIEQFVEYFWKALHPALFIPPLLQRSGGADLVLELDAHHQVTAIYRNC